jgi:hypothetical protein
MYCALKIVFPRVGRVQEPNIEESREGAQKMSKISSYFDIIVS